MKSYGSDFKCPTKCWLRAVGEPFTGNAYAEWVNTQNESYRAAETERLLAQTPPGSPSIRHVAAEVTRL